MTNKDAVVSSNGLNEAAVDPNPFKQFQAWFDEAVAAQVHEPNAMLVATATRAGRPSARMVLMRGFDERGVVFFTNYESRKGGELAENPFASIVFYWSALNRQVRIEGAVECVSAQESDAYFMSRPASHRIATLASRQSAVVASRALLEERSRALEAQYPDGPPRPDHWGGYRVAPDAFEFWQSGANRLHDRLRYRRQANGLWLIERLSP